MDSSEIIMITFSMAAIITFAIVVWIIYGYPVRALIKDLENESLRLKIQLKKMEEDKSRRELLERTVYSDYF